MNRRVLLLTLSVLVAALGTGLVALYVKGADDRARAGQELVEVLVASRPIPQGTPASKLTGAGRVKQAFVSANAFPRTRVITAAAAGETLKRLNDAQAAFTIPEGTPLLVDYFERSTGTSAARNGKVLVEIAIAGPNQIAGAIGVDDTVTVLLSEKDSRGKTWVEVDDATIYAINGRAGDAATTLTPEGADGTVTLSVDPDEAKRLVIAKAAGLEFYLVTPGKSNVPAEPDDVGALKG